MTNEFNQAHPQACYLIRMIFYSKSTTLKVILENMVITVILFIDNKYIFLLQLSIPVLKIHD